MNVLFSNVFYIPPVSQVFLKLRNLFGATAHTASMLIELTPNYAAFQDHRN